jgi:hypothetical protein
MPEEKSSVPDPIFLKHRSRSFFLYPDFTGSVPDPDPTHLSATVKKQDFLVYHITDARFLSSLIKPY